MPGVTRRPKPLKAKSPIGDITGITITSPQVLGDLLVADAANEFRNTQVLTGTYTINAATIAALTATEGTVTNDLSVGNNASITGTLTVGGTAIVTGAATLDSTLVVAGAATLSDTLAVAGTLTGAGFSFSGSGTITQNLTVTGTATIGTLVLSDASFTGNVNIAGYLQVAGATILNDDLTVNANISGGAVGGTTLSSSGAISGSGSLSIAKLGWSASGQNVTAALKGSTGTYTITGIQTDLTVVNLIALNPEVATGGGITVVNLEVDGDLDHDGTLIGFYGTAPAAQSSAYTLNATAVLDRTLLASASATTLNNNNVLAALITDLQAIGIIA
jgi:hypothetical protein